MHLNHHIHDFVAKVTQFRQGVNQFPTHSNERIYTPKFLADMMEAVVGAVWVDSSGDLVTTGAVINKLLGPLIGDHAFLTETNLTIVEQQIQEGTV